LAGGFVGSVVPARGVVLPIAAAMHKILLFFFAREGLNYRVLNLFLKSFTKKTKQVLCKRKNPLIFAPALGLGKDDERDGAVGISLVFRVFGGLFFVVPLNKFIGIL
jgi:hypothetical protein